MPETGRKYDGRGSRSPQRGPSRYGADEQLGAQNELSPGARLKVLRLPRAGKIVELAQIPTPAALLLSRRIAHQVTLAQVSPGGSELLGARAS